jgi:carbamoyl-phosphate synthase small subunit
VNEEDCESDKVHLEGIIAHDIVDIPSNFRSTQSLKAFLKANKTFALSQVDTRAITHILREKGSQNACITDELDSFEALERAKSFAGLLGMDLATLVSTKAAYQWEKGSIPLEEKNEYPQQYHVVALDFGIKRGILRCLVDEGCCVTVVPAHTSSEEILNLKPDGIFLSNGPGDPGVLTDIISHLKQLIKTDIPIFGICLGFQLLALALGAKTVKMKFGHHGGNHPVINEESRRVLISSQNHGFMVDENTLPSETIITHRSLFDGSLQGIRLNQLFGFQGHPEAAPGPHEVMVLFEQFREAMASVAK